MDDQERIGEDLFTLILKFPVYDPLPNPLMRGEVLVFVRSVRRASPRLIYSDSGSPRCYAWFQDGDPQREATGIQGGVL